MLSLIGETALGYAGGLPRHASTRSVQMSDSSKWSASLPFLSRPAALTGKMIGDVGFVRARRRPAARLARAGAHESRAARCTRAATCYPGCARARACSRAAGHARATPCCPNLPRTQDPVGFSSIDGEYINLKWMREAELKHGRICMLATLGWVMVDIGFHLSGMRARLVDGGSGAPPPLGPARGATRGAHLAGPRFPRPRAARAARAPRAQATSTPG
jgi:hypothetical protein